MPRYGQVRARDLVGQGRCNVPLAVAVLVLWGGVGRGAERTSVDPVEPDVRVAVEADWAAQERRAGREPGSPAAITAALSRSRQLLDRLGPLLDPATIESAEQAWLTLSAAVEDLEALSPHGREALYLRLRWAARDWALLNPLWAQRPILFLQRKRFICQMLHEYIGYYYNYGNLAGGGVYVLERPGYSFAKRDLVAGRLPRGAFATPALSYDGRTAYFAFSEVRDTPRSHRVGHTWHILPPADQVPPEFNYYTPQRAVFQLYAVDADGGELRRLTAGRDDDFGPCPLPDGDLIFMSSRRGGFCRCDNPFEPIPTHTLHRLDMRTGAVRTLSWHETNEWHPALLSDGRIVYCRWDYVDRSAAHYHGLWVSNPDGSNPSILFGNYTQDISACYQPSAVPGSRKIVFVAGAHHANVGGSLVLFDPARARLDGETGEDRFESLERLTPEVCFAETSGRIRRRASTTSTGSATWSCCCAKRVSAVSPPFRSGPALPRRRFPPQMCRRAPRRASSFWPTPTGRCCRRLRIGPFASCGFTRCCRRKRRTSRISHGSVWPMPNRLACCWDRCPSRRTGRRIFAHRPTGRCISSRWMTRGVLSKACGVSRICSRANDVDVSAVMRHRAQHPQPVRCLRRSDPRPTSGPVRQVRGR
ncbi:MAG: hypothetical protein MUF48_15095 [Pirellulaceae bacterium]|nr:hypothetical protein [Pirellulaceae bacterium]